MTHDWRVLLQYELTDDEARKMVQGYGHPEVDDAPDMYLAGDQDPPKGDPRVFLGRHNLIRNETVVLCWVCEQAWTEELAKKSCIGRSAFPADLGQMVTEPKPPLGNVRAGLGPISRNEPCPCGSGKKFKRCCGA